MAQDANGIGATGQLHWPPRGTIVEIWYVDLQSDDGIGGVCKDMGCQVQNWKSDPEVNVSELGLVSGNDGAVDG